MVYRKEIYYRALKQDENIGFATVYRMINTLEEIGAISRKNMYKIACGEECDIQSACIIEFEDDTALELSARNWAKVIQMGLSACGYLDDRKLRSVTAKPCECEKE